MHNPNHFNQQQMPTKDLKEAKTCPVKTDAYQLGEHRYPPNHHRSQGHNQPPNQVISHQKNREPPNLK